LKGTQISSRIDRFTDEALQKVRRTGSSKSGREMLYSICCSNTKKQNITRRYAVYGARKTRRESRYHYEEYDVGLCAVPCFKIYHTQTHF
jgi:hypothetical protein